MKIKGEKKKADILEFIADEISGVDVPAQMPAVVVMTKRETEDLPEKEPRIAEEVDMSEELTKKVTELEGQVEALNAQLKKSAKLLELSDSQKEFHKSLSGDEADSFLGLSSGDRDALIEKAQSKDETITVSGVTMHKSILGEEAFKAMVDTAAELKKAKKKAKEEAEKACAERLKKQASDLKHLPGTEDAKVALLKQIDGIEDEEMRKQALSVLQANNKEMSKAFDEVAHQSPSDDTPPDEKLTKMAKKHAEDNEMSFEKAYTEILVTPEGAALYEKTQK